MPRQRGIEPLLEQVAVSEPRQSVKMRQLAAGTVRVSAIPLIVNRLLMPALRDLYAAHPQLCLQAIAEPRNVSLTKREADIALRLARPDREQKVIARRIGTLSYAVYGPSGRTAGSLRWITYDPGMMVLPHVAWIEKAIRLDRGAPASLTVNDSEVALHAIRAGIGKSCCRAWWEIASGV
jgi:DNA-binding transcriptional LysR family regulator